jgi:oxygen-dependent protoporphyrinogen oxidase
MPRVVIVGGGVSGLSIAYELLERGVSPGELCVLEAADRPGGNIRSHREDGFLVEAGPNGFLDNSPPTLELVRRLGLGDRLLPSEAAAARRFIYRAGRLHLVPSGPLGLLRSGLLTLPGRLRIFREPFVPRDGHPEESVFDFAARRIGSEAARILVDSMVSGVFAGDARRLELRAAFPKMAEMEARYGSLVRAMMAMRRQRRASGGPAGPGGRLTSFREGMEELIRALAHRLGASLMTGTAVRTLERVGAGYVVTLASGQRVEAPAVVLACPAPRAAGLVGGLDDALADLLSGIPTAPLVVVATAYRLEDLGEAPHGFGFLVPRGQGVRILGCLWSSSIWKGRAPEGMVLLRTMLGGAHDPDAVGLDDAELLAVVAEDLRRTMRLVAKPVRTWIWRHPLGIPQYVPGHTRRLDRIAARLASHPGLFLAGNSYRGISVNQCVAEAAQMAERIREFLKPGTLGVGLPGKNAT